MVGAGLSEMMTYSFIKANAYDKMLLPADDARRNCIELLNPITDAFSVMRTTMVPSALQTAPSTCATTTAVLLCLKSAVSSCRRHCR